MSYIAFDAGLENPRFFTTHFNSPDSATSSTAHGLFPVGVANTEDRSLTVSPWPTDLARTKRCMTRPVAHFSIVATGGVFAMRPTTGIYWRRPDNAEISESSYNIGLHPIHKIILHCFCTAIVSANAIKSEDRGILRLPTTAFPNYLRGNMDSLSIGSLSVQVTVSCKT